MKKIIACLAILVYLLPGTAMAGQGYVWIGESEAEEYYLDSGRIFFAGVPIYTSATRQDVVDAWIKAVYKQPAASPNPALRLADAFVTDGTPVECVLHIQADLRAKRMALLEKTELNRWGEVVQGQSSAKSAQTVPSVNDVSVTTSPPQPDWITVRPGTLLKPVYEAVAAYVDEYRDIIEHNSLRPPRDFVSGR